jgi:hypothetical protein
MITAEVIAAAAAEFSPELNTAGAAELIAAAAAELITAASELPLLLLLN